ncbi:MAG: hypothetical protein P1U37_01900 [Minwuia sp.]|nr:hypothetical protein [Minwuia sp.]
MSVFRVSSLLGLCLFLPALALAQTGSAEGQGTGPKSLLPATVNTGTEADARPPSDQSVTTGGIVIGRLDAPGEAAAGLLGPSSGGLGLGLWEGSSAGIVHALYGRMPAHFASPAAHDLARRLLLSIGTPPTGSDSAALLGQRMALLITMGEADSAVALAEAASSGDLNNPAYNRPLVDALLLSGDVKRACDLVGSQVRGGSRDFWQRASVFCDLQAGRRPDADLTRTILGETGSSNPVFDDLADAIADGVAVELEDASQLSPLHLAMFRLGPKATLKSVTGLAPAIAARLATMPRLTTPMRLDAGIEAMRTGTLQPAAVTLILGAPDADLNADDFRQAAVAYARAEGKLARAEAMLAMWTVAASRGDAAMAAALAAPALERMLPSVDLAFLAPVAFRMHLLNGDRDRARGWLELLRRRAAAGERDAVLAQTAALPLAQVSGIDPVNNRRLGNWRDANPAGEGADRQWHRILLLMDAIGRPVAEALWTGALQSPAVESASDAVTDAALWRQLVLATGAGRTGEAVQAALALMGPAGPGRLDPVALASVVGSLRRLGLAPAAERLAVEALIATEVRRSGE